MPEKSMRDTFVQIGATRDGREGYMEAAHRRGMDAVLVERPEQLTLRQAAGRRSFDATIALASPADHDSVRRELERLGAPIRLVLAGFERYTACAHSLSKLAGLPHGGPGFSAASKLEQRRTLTRDAPWVLQPRYCAVSPEPLATLPGDFPYPAVLKPIDGAGGLGVMLVRNPQQLLDSLNHAAPLRNYDNAELRGWMVEEYINAPEWSIQGICRAGVCRVLSACSKVIASEPLSGLPSVAGFREVAHIARGPANVPHAFLRFAADCAAAFGYRDGPFHIDFREGADGPVFIEMGFRLSGAAVTDLVREVSGVDWAEAVFASMLREETSEETLCGPQLPCSVAHVLAFSQLQVDLAARAAAHHEIRIEPIRSPREALSPEVARALTADLSRHTGPVARIQIRGRDVNQVRTLAQAISGIQSTEMENNDEQRMELSNVSVR